MYHAHTFTPDRFRHPRSSQVSCPSFAGQWNGVEVPQVLAGPDVERARVAGLGERDFTGRRTEDRDVPVDRRHAVPRHARSRRCRCVPKPATGMPVAASSATSRGPGREQDARSEPTVAGPVRDAARRRRHAERHQVPPHLLAGMRLDREHLVAPRRQIHHAADHDRRGLRVAAVARIRRWTAACLTGRRIPCGASAATCRCRLACGRLDHRHDVRLRAASVAPTRQARAWRRWWC